MSVAPSDFLAYYMRLVLRCCCINHMMGSTVFGVHGCCAKWPSVSVLLSCFWRAFGNADDFRLAYCCRAFSVPLACGLHSDDVLLPCK
jgi:hypothetical protein